MRRIAGKDTVETKIRAFWPDCRLGTYNITSAMRIYLYLQRLSPHDLFYISN